MAKIDVTLDVKEAKAVMAWLRYRKSIEAVNQEMTISGKITDRNKQKAQDHFKSVKKMGLEAVTSFTGIGSVLSGIATAATMINQQHEELLQRQRNQFVTGRDFGSVMRDVRVAFTEDNTVKDKELEDQILRISKRTRTNENIVGTALIDTFSARGAKSNQDALNATEAAFSLIPNNLEAGKTLAARALDLANAFNSDNMRANVGFMQNIQNTARITSLEKVGANLLPGIISVTQQGDSPEQAAELAVTMTKLMTDAEGRLTRTAITNMSSRMAEFVPSEKGKDNRGEFTVPVNQIADYENAKSTTDRISVMQRSPELLRQFFSQFTFDAASTASVKSLLSGSDVARAQYSSSQELIKPLDDNQVKTFEAKVQQIEGGIYQTLVRAEEQSNSNISNARLLDIKGQLEGAAYDIFKKTQTEVGSGWGDSLATFLGKGTIDDLQGLNNIETYIKSLKNIRYERDEKEQSIIDDQIKILEELNERYKSLDPPSQPGFLDKLKKGAKGIIDNDTVKMFTGEKQAPGTRGFDRGVDQFLGIQRQQQQTMEKHTQALEDNTAALKAQTEKPVVAQKPIQVQVNMSADTSTAPNGPRTSASLARPAK